MPQPPSPAERALRAIADAAGDGRERVESDLTDPTIPVAATVVLLRDCAAGPGGAHDRAPRSRLVRGRLGVSRRQARTGRPRPDRRCDARPKRPTRGERRCGRRCEETGLEVAASDLVTLSCWDPPPGTRAAHPDLVLRRRGARAASCASSRMKPSRRNGCGRRMRCERQARGELTLYPPTWVTLHGLQRRRPTSPRRSPRRGWRGIRTFETQVRRGADRARLLLARGCRVRRRPGGCGIRTPSPARRRRHPLGLHAPGLTASARAASRAAGGRAHRPRASR